MKMAPPWDLEITNEWDSEVAEKFIANPQPMAMISEPRFKLTLRYRGTPVFVMRAGRTEFDEPMIEINSLGWEDVLPLAKLIEDANSRYG